VVPLCNKWAELNGKLGDKWEEIEEKESKAKEMNRTCFFQSISSPKTVFSNFGTQEISGSRGVHPSLGQRL
jgi:hypothetical protein